MNEELIGGGCHEASGMRHISGSKVSFEQVEEELIHERKGEDVYVHGEVCLHMEWGGQSIEGIPTCQTVFASYSENRNSKRADTCLSCHHYNLNP